MFKGFPTECVGFFHSLELNNTRKWFEEHKQEYQDFILTPARHFVIELGTQLKRLFPNLVVDPRIDRSIFRIHRDTRFSTDKTPFKTHLGIYFWESSLPKLESPGFYFELNTSGLLIANGIYRFSKSIQEEYRHSLVDRRLFRVLDHLCERLLSHNRYYIGGEYYKRIPHGYTASEENADYFLHNGLYIFYESALIKKLHTPDIIHYTLTHFKRMAPLHRWLTALVERTNRGEILEDSILNTLIKAP